MVLHCRNVHPHLEVTSATEFPTRPVENPEPPQGVESDSVNELLSTSDSSSTSQIGRNLSSAITASDITRTSTRNLHRSKSALLGLLSGDSNVLDSLNRSPQRAAGFPGQGDYIKNTSQGSTSKNPDSLSKQLMGQSLLNPQLNSLELSLRLAQLERNQQLHRELLAATGEQSNDEEDESSTSAA